MYKLKKVALIVFTTITLLILITILFLNSSFNSQLGPPIEIKGTERYFELVNKHPLTPDEYKEFQEEEEKFKKIQAKYFKSIGR